VTWHIGVSNFTVALMQQAIDNTVPGRLSPTRLSKPPQFAKPDGGGLCDQARHSHHVVHDASAYGKVLHDPVLPLLSVTKPPQRRWPLAWAGAAGLAR
jgi:hypothetical protein